MTALQSLVLCSNNLNHLKPFLTFSFDFERAPLVAIMRLINVKTGRFEEFIGSRVPKYAILSHTWGDREVSFKEMEDRSGLSKDEYRKIKETCRLASEYQLDYAWIDTCCIDKSSSAELSEAINSMYRWYERSTVCFAFLADLSPPASTGLEDDIGPALRKCRWFTRGWTLQELIAPATVHFFDQCWTFRGSKETLVRELTAITAISEDVLLYNTPLPSLPVARKMSWAAHRETTRIEDTAYCLLGLFGVNMPLLYGEEQKAFRRLQEEIIRSIVDRSIFAWELSDPSATTDSPLACGLLAWSPLAFSAMTDFVSNDYSEPHEVSVTNLGLRTSSTISRFLLTDGQHHYALPLNGRSEKAEPEDREQSYGVILRKCGPDYFVRENPAKLILGDFRRVIFVRGVVYLLTDVSQLPQDSSSFHTREMSLILRQVRRYALRVRLPEATIAYDVCPSARWDLQDELFFVSSSSRVYDCCLVRFNVQLEYQIRQKQTTIGGEYIFIALGWSTAEPQYTVVEYEPYVTALNEIRSLVENGLQRLRLVRDLLYYGIPRKGAAIKSVPGTTMNLVTSFNLREECMTDDHLRIWTTSLGYKIYQADDLPIVQPRKWGPLPE